MDCSDENEVPTNSQVFSVKAKEKNVDEAQSVAGQFTNYYYEMLQKKPHLVGQLYLENSILLWDGNPVFQREGIQKFIEQQMPPLTINLMSMDCQTLNGAAVGPKQSFLINLAGQYRISGPGVVKQFTQQLVIVADNNKWRIATDQFRTVAQPTFY